jgi:chaperone LolA
MKLFKLFVNILTFVGITIYCSASFAERSAEELQSLFQQMQSIQGNFTQKLMGDQSVIQASTGEMQIQKPNKFRWQITSPNPQLILGDGKKLWIYDKDLAQVTVKAMQGNLDKTPAALLSGSDRVLAEYSIEHRNNWFILTPKTKKSDYEWIKIQFQGHTITAMLLKDKLGQTSQLKFSNIKMNTSLDKNLFQFKPPKGVDVIE